MSRNHDPNPANVTATFPKALRLLSAAAVVGLAIGFAVWRVTTIPTPYRETTPVPTGPTGRPPELQVDAKATTEEDEELAFRNLRASFSGRHFQFRIDPKTPVKDLLPEPPKARGDGRPVTGDDLTRVPEVSLQEPIRNAATPGSDGEEESTREEIAIAYQIARMNHLNLQKAGSFLDELRAARPDLAGLPFLTGNDCSSDAQRTKPFLNELARLRSAHRFAVRAVGGLSPVPDDGRIDPERFWNRYRSKKVADAKELPARVAAMMQVMAVPPSDLLPGLVDYLSGVGDASATRALARLAIFSAGDDVRRGATDALANRRATDYTDILLQGLHYPWPAVAGRAAKTIARLGRTDLAPRLVELLEDPDPRAPVVKESGGKRLAVVRELVRVNHHRNCLLCHSTGNLSPDPTAPTAPVPLPCQPLPSAFGDYGEATAELLVRFDVTFLRQDFSVLQPVADANPWPEMQRFDFLVRTRELTDAEAADFRDKFAKPEPGRPSPYRKAALAALRELTGKDTEPTAEGWRRLLNLPPGQKTAIP